MSAFKTCYTIFDVTANLLISREVFAFSCQILDKGGLFSPLLWLLWRKWRDLLQRERGIYCGERGEVLRRNRGLSLASHVAGRSTKKKTTRCPKTCVVFSLVIRKLSFLFELCVFFFVLCIRCYSKLPLKLGIVFEKPFRDLHRIEGSSLFDLVAHQPESEAIGVGQVFADATHKHVVATFEQEGHRIFAH